MRIPMLFRFSLYGFLKNQRYYDPFLILAFREKGLSFFQIGILYGFREICTNLFEIPSGALADLYGRRRAMIFSFCAYIVSFATVGGFAVSGETFYIEHQRRLFKWKPGTPEWINTDLIDLGKQSSEDSRKGFQLAVSGKTVYVGKRAGRLFQSLDAGDSWKDVTSSLPLRFSRFNAIVFAGSRVYIATDTGVLTSQDGESWRVLTDGMGTRIVIDRFAVDGTTPQNILICGAGDTGVYRLSVHDKWERISPGVPGQVLSLVVDRDKLYVATKHRGMFHISLEEKNYIVNN